MTTNSLSRRAILSRAVAAAPAVALAPLPAIAAATVSPDAELIALGREIEAFLPRHAIVVLESCVRSWKAHRLADDQPGSPTLGEAEAEFDCEAWDAENDKSLKEETRLMDAVAALPATTPEGVRVKALVVAMSNIINIAHDPASPILDYIDMQTRDLALSVLNELGVTIPEHLIGAASA